MTIKVDIVNDEEEEDDEYFDVVLSDPQRCTLGEWKSATVIVVDHDFMVGHCYRYCCYYYVGLFVYLIFSNKFEYTF